MLSKITGSVGAAVAAAAAFMIAGCGHHSADERIAQSESLVDEGDYEASRRIADQLMRRGDEETLPVSAYVKLSLIYMRLSEIENLDDNIALATKCYRHAFRINADSADYYYRSLTDSDALRGGMLSTIVAALTDTSDTDSLGVDTIYIYSETPDSGAFILPHEED